MIGPIANPSVEGVKRKTGSQIAYSDLGPIEGYISKRVQDRTGKLVAVTNRKSYGLSIGTKIGDLE